jgi:hypothetical protein
VSLPFKGHDRGSAGRVLWLLPTMQSALVVGIPSPCIASLQRYSPMVERDTTRPSPSRENGVSPAPYQVQITHFSPCSFRASPRRRPILIETGISRPVDGPVQDIGVRPCSNKRKRKPFARHGLGLSDQCMMAEAPISHSALDDSLRPVLLMEPGFIVRRCRLSRFSSKTGGMPI